MKKTRVLQVLFIGLLLVAMVLLTGEIFGQMRPLMLKIFSVSWWVALLCSGVCTVILAFQNKKKEKD